MSDKPAESAAQRIERQLAEMESGLESALRRRSLVERTLAATTHNSYATGPPSTVKSPGPTGPDGSVPVAAAPPRVNQSGFTQNDPSVTIAHQPRELTMHSVTEEELSTLRGVIPSTTLSFFGIAFGAALAMWGVLATSGLSAHNRDTFNALFWVFRILTAFFAILSIAGYVHQQRVVNRVRTRAKK